MPSQKVTRYFHEYEGFSFTHEELCRDNDNGYVYVITYDGKTKIGKSRNYKQRLKSIIDMGGLYIKPLQISVFPTSKHGKVESKAHSILDKYLLSSEWFLLSHNKCKVTVLNLISEPKIIDKIQYEKDRVEAGKKANEQMEKMLDATGTIYNKKVELDIKTPIPNYSMEYINLYQKMDKILDEAFCYCEKVSEIYNLKHVAEEQKAIAYGFFINFWDYYKEAHDIYQALEYARITNPRFNYLKPIEFPWLWPESKN